MKASADQTVSLVLKILEIKIKDWPGQILKD